jgi:hypothetical protein
MGDQPVVVPQMLPDRIMATTTQIGPVFDSLRTRLAAATRTVP